MFKKGVLLFLAALFALGTAACGAAGSAQAETEVPAEAAEFLTAVYTTDQGGRYTAYLEAAEAAADEKGAAAALSAYYERLSLVSLATGDLLEQLNANRVPYKYDKLYADTPATVDSIAFEASEEAEESCDFVVTLTVGGRTETRTGSLRWETDGDSVLVSSFWEADG